MSNQDSDSSSESFSDIVLPSIVTPTSVGSLINEFLIDLSPDSNFNLISYFTSIDKEKIAHIYAESNSKLNVRICGLNEFFVNLPSQGEQPSFREGFCCVEIPGFTIENHKSESRSSSSSKSSSSRSKSSNSILLLPKYTPSIAIFGGKSDSSLMNSELYTYSFSTNVWKKITLISSELSSRVGHRAVALNKDEHTFIYVFGGSNGFYLEENLLLICLCGDFASCSIIECEGTDKPCGRCDHSMTLVTDFHSAFQLKTNNPASPQKGPIYSQPPPVISIPSMSSFPEIASAVQSNPSSTAFENTTKSINMMNTGPAWALVFGGKISNECSDIDLNRKFNEKIQEKVLCDLWKLELRDPFDVPRWTLISREGPPGRHSHAAFYKEGQFFIAGGYNEKGLPLKDVWRYTFGFGWEEIAVFNNNSIINIFGSPKHGFVQIKSQDEKQKENKDSLEGNLFVSPLKMDPSLVLLSNEFDKLRKKQRMMWNSISEKMEEIDLLEIEIENGKRFIKNPEAFSKSKSKSKSDKENENIIGPDFINNISKVKKLEEQIKGLRLQLFNDFKQNVSTKKDKIEYPKENYPKLADFTLELHQKIALKTEKFQKRKRELELEIQLYTNQKKILEKTNSVDAKSQSSKELVEYTEKLRELETFKEKTINAEKKLDQMRRKQVLDDQYIMNLIDEVSKWENKIAKTDKEILKWEAIVERSKIENKMVNSILKVCQAGNQSSDQQQSSKSKSKSKSKTVDSEKIIQKVLKSNNSLRSKIKEELKSFIDEKNSSFQYLIHSIDSILSSIDDSKQLSECKSSIVEKTINFPYAIDVLEAPFSKL